MKPSNNKNQDNKIGKNYTNKQLKVINEDGTMISREDFEKNLYMSSRISLSISNFFSRILSLITKSPIEDRDLYIETLLKETQERIAEFKKRIAEDKEDNEKRRAEDKEKKDQKLEEWFKKNEKERVVLKEWNNERLEEWIKNGKEITEFKEHNDKSDVCHALRMKSVDLSLEINKNDKKKYELFRERQALWHETQKVTEEMWRFTDRQQQHDNFLDALSEMHTKKGDTSEIDALKQQIEKSIILYKRANAIEKEKEEINKMTDRKERVLDVEKHTEELNQFSETSESYKRISKEFQDIYKEKKELETKLEKKKPILNIESIKSSHGNSSNKEKVLDEIKSLEEKINDLNVKKENLENSKENLELNQKLKEIKSKHTKNTISPEEYKEISKKLNALHLEWTDIHQNNDHEVILNCRLTKAEERYYKQKSKDNEKIMEESRKRNQEIEEESKEIFRERFEEIERKIQEKEDLTKELDRKNEKLKEQMNEADKIAKEFYKEFLETKDVDKQDESKVNDETKLVSEQCEVENCSDNEIRSDDENKVNENKPHDETKLENNPSNDNSKKTLFSITQENIARNLSLSSVASKENDEMMKVE